MKVYHVEELTGIEVLAKDVFTPEYQILLSAGTILKREYIEKLKELRVREVWVEENDPRTRKVVILKEEVKESFKSKVQSILEKHTYSHNKELQELCHTADRIITNILEEDRVVEQIYDIKGRSSDIYEHSISICSLATVVALKMNIPRYMIHDIGVGCLLHDLGLRYLTIDYTDVDFTKLPESEYAEYKKHPIYGYTALRGENWISKASKNMILYHHECLDGSGYPLKATDIPWECSIIQVCDTFDEMICGIGCKRVKVHEAIEYLKNYKNIKFDGEVVDIFLAIAAVYPAGTIVKTNEEEIGVVLYQNKEFPNRPVLRIIKDKDGNDSDIVKDLIKVNNIYIEEVIG